MKTPVILLVVGLLLGSFLTEAQSKILQEAFDRYHAFWNPTEGVWEGSDPKQIFDPEFTAVDNFGGRLIIMNSYEDFRSTWQPMMEAGFSELNVNFTEVAFREGQTVALITFKIDISESLLKNGESAQGGQIGTHVWIKKKKTWLLLREHLSSL